MRTVNALRWGLIALFIVLLAGPAIVVAVGGLTVVEVDGRSMEPTIKFGDVVVIREPRASDFVVGSIVTAEDSTGAKYTHRIVGLDDSGDLLLRGDNNTVDDPAPVPTSDVVGVVDGQFSGPAATFVTQLQSWPLRVCLLTMIIGLVFLPMPTFRRPEATDERPARAGRRSASRRGAGRTATPAPAAVEDPRLGQQPVPEAEREEALELVDGLRSSMARVLLASDRRLGGRITVTTGTGPVGPFPSLRVVIDIAEKEATVRAAEATASVGSSTGRPLPRSRRELRGQTTPREVVQPVTRSRTTPIDPADAAALLWTRASGSLPDDLPTRRSHRDAHRHGRRRAR